ncbi:MAG: 2-phospho-L-lactate transferase CofD family protein [Burkholderiaceae bacterium]
MLNVVIINGGRGAAALIPALLGQQGLHVTSVVNAYDDGKSTGEIRRFFGMLGPSDIRKVQELLLPESDPDHTAHLQVFQYRYPKACDRAKVLASLRAFADASLIDLVGVQFANRKVDQALRRFLREFLDGLAVIEKARGEQFSFADCSIMNCIYAGAFLTFDRNIETATRYIDRLFKLKGTVLPTSIEDKKLVGLRENGEMLYCEADIVELRSNVRIERVYLLDGSLDKPRFELLDMNEKRYYLDRHHCFVTVSQGVRLALQQADIIIYSAGTQHSSLYPTYMSAGLAQAIADNKSAYKVFVTNIGADYETPSYQASDYIRGAHRYLNLSDPRDYSMEELFDVMLVNQSRLKADETYVNYDEAGFADVPVRRVVDAFESPASPGKHDGPKVVQTILALYEAATVLP